MKPLRILLTSFDYSPRVGGVATCASELALALARSNAAEVRMVAPKRSRSPDQVAQKENVSTCWVDLPLTAMLAVPQLALALRKEIRDWKPDAVIAMLWMPDGLALSFSRTGIPVYVFAHGVEMLESQRSWKKRLRSKLSFLKRRSFNRARGVFAVSSYTAGLVRRETGLNKDKITVVFNGVDLAKFSPKSKTNGLVVKHTLEDKFVFMTVCRLVPHKGVDVALRALGLLRKREPSALWSYVICGSGPMRARLEAIAAEEEISDRVIFAGGVADNELAQYYNLCDCFVLLSREDLDAPNVEGFGIVFLEAAACGKPSIAGRSGGVPDAVADGESGWLVSPNDVSEVATVMARVLNDPTEAVKRGDAARARVERSFTWERVAEKVLHAISESR